MAKCPNCNAELNLNGVCPACGYVAPLASNDPYGELLIKKGKYDAARGLLEKILQKNPNDGKANLLFVRCLTKDFTSKSKNAEEALEYAVKGLTYATEKEKNEYKALFSQYFENERNGGKSIKMVYDRTADNYVSTESASSSATTSSSSPRTKKSRSRGGGGNFKKPLLIVSSVLLVGAVAASLIFTLGNKNNKYTRVSFETNGGVGGSSYVENYYNKRPKNITIPTKVGYKFNGYWTSTTYRGDGGSYSGSGTIYYTSTGTCSYSTWTVSKKKLTLYASWEKFSTSVYFNREGGEGGTSSRTIDGGETYVTVSVPTKTGYNFKGYYTGSNGSGTKYFDENGYLVPSSWDYEETTLTLYAYWVGKTTRVTFSTLYGSAPSAVNNKYGSSYSSITPPYYYGHTFRGFYTEQYGYGTQYYNSYGNPTNSKWLYDGETVTLYADWD